MPLMQTRIFVIARGNWIQWLAKTELDTFSVTDPVVGQAHTCAGLIKTNTGIDVANV